jgi:hypothetical protein
MAAFRAGTIRTSPFGIGTRRQLRLSRAVSLGPSGQAELLFPLHQEVLAGDPRTGVHIRIEHPNDPVSINNAGSQVHDGGYTTESGRDFEIEVPVLNDSGLSRQIDLIILSTDLLVTVTPSSHFFAPFQQISATVRIRVPSFLSGSSSNVIERAVTIIGQVSGGPMIGGVTRLLRIDS